MTHKQDGEKGPRGVQHPGETRKKPKSFSRTARNMLPQVEAHRSKEYDSEEDAIRELTSLRRELQKLSVGGRKLDREQRRLIQGLKSQTVFTDPETGKV